MRSWLKLLTKEGPAKKSSPASQPDHSSKDYAIRKDWSGSEGEINFSSFVYFDVDRDGHYGMSDRPFGGIKVRLKKDNDVIKSTHTNNNGFANFKSSSTNAAAPINKPGNYEFIVSVPPSFTVTSGNAAQCAEFKPSPGSISGIVSDEMLQPVGLAPNRVISGRLPEKASVSVKALNGADVVEEAVYSNRAQFSYAVPIGADQVEFTTSDLTRRVLVSPYPIEIGLLDAKRGALNAEGSTHTINFDDVTPRGLRKIPSGYAGLNWFNLNAVSRDFTKQGQGYVNGNTSGDHVAYTSTGYPALIYSETPFDFVGVHLSVAWLKAEGETGIIEAWQGDELAARDSVSLSALTPVFYNPCLPKITKLRFATEHCWQMVMDDLIIAR